MERFFTRDIPEGKTVYDLFTWKNVNVNITDYKTGKTLFAADNLEFPENYSQNACDIIAKMYFRKAGVPDEYGYEHSMKQVAHRMVSFWMEAAADEGIITEDEMIIMYDELVYMLLNQMWAPNSPQWFNTGLKLAYGISGDPAGISYYDTKKGRVVEAKDAYTRTQASACFIVNVNDSLLGDQSLMDNLTTASRLFKYGSGIGSNWSKIRGINEKLSSGGKSSGLLSFQKVFDKNAGAIKSGGTTRRAAVMEILDVDHPEIFDFVRWKAREEDKVVALGKMGYDTGIAGDAYETVSGQNVNNSVSIPDEFMKAVDDPDIHKWTLTGRVDPSVNTDVDPNLLWDEIAWAAWRCGDPGVQFSDTINAWHTCLNDGRIRASNPCSEYLFLDDTACNLASINVMKFYTSNARHEDLPDNACFDFDGFIYAVQMIQYALEASVHWGAFPTKQIAKNTHLYRTTGIGLTNMGALVMAMALPYDSDEARNYLAFLCSTMTGASYAVSAEMAKKVGAFPRFEKNKNCMLSVIDKHSNAFVKVVKQIPDSLISEEDKNKVLSLWASAYEDGHGAGFRNAQVSVLAPTGTIAFAMDCASTSSEPFFAHKVYKKIVDGSTMTMVNDLIPVALAKLGYTDSEINDISKYILDGDGKIEGAPHLKEEHLPIFDTANRCGTGTRYLSPESHVRMVAALQPHISGGISKTVNLPADATVDDIKNIYHLAWELGCKCIALYRDGCKVMQPLTTAIDKNADPNDLSNLGYWDLLKHAQELQETLNAMRVKQAVIVNKNADAPDINDEEDHSPDRLIRERLPYEPKCIKNAVKMGGVTYHIQRSFYDDGRLGEIFVSVGKQGNTIKGLTEVLCILISKCLQYGIPAEVISDILRNTEFQPNGIVRQHPNIKSASSIPDLISKFIDISIGNYQYCQVKPESKDKDVTPVTSTKETITVVKDGEKQEITGERVYDHTCPVCGSTHIIKAGTCHYCQNCGTSSGCS